MSILDSEELSDFPAGPVAGDHVFNTTLDGLYVYAPGATDALMSGWLRVEDGKLLRSSERVTDTLTRAAYAGRDYQTIVDEIVANLKKQFGDVFNDFITSDATLAMIKYFAAALDTQAFNLDSRATEASIFLAVLRKSIAREARALGYKPGRSTAATVDMMVNLDDGPYGFDVKIPAGFQFDGPDNLVFEQVSDLLIPAGQTNSTTVAPNGVGYSQVETLRESFTSNGNSNQRFELRKIPTGKYISQGSFLVTVNGEEWTESDFLPFDRTNEYEVFYDGSPPQLRFGDGVIGNIPANGADISVLYKVTRGRSGNSVPIGEITDQRSVLTVNFQNIAVSGSNLNKSTGGEDPEDARSIRTSAPGAFAAADRAVSPPDWDTLLNNFRDSIAGAVARGRAETIRGIENELTIRGLLEAINLAATGQGIVTGSIYDQMKSHNTAIRTSATALSAFVDSANASVESALSSTNDVSLRLTDITDSVELASDGLDELKLALSNISYQESIGKTDGLSSMFAASLSKVPVVEGTVSIFLNPLSQKSSGALTSDSSDGTIEDTASIGAAVGDLIKARGFYRRVRAILSSTKIEYDGPPIPLETGDPYVVYNKSIAGFDDGDGAITGVGIQSGTVDYDTGAIVVTFTATPAGSTEFGSPIQCSYQYSSPSLIGKVTDADALISTVSDSVSSARSANDAVSTAVTAANTAVDSMDDQLSAIISESLAGDSDIDLSKQVSTNVSDAVQDLYDYLDEVISGECKANIVQLRVLVHDSGGNFAAPSNLLLSKIKDYFDDRKPITVTVSPVSGMRDLIAANISIKIELKRNRLYSDVQPLVDSAVTLLLKDRKYGKALLLSELYGLIVPDVDGNGGIDGVASADIKITGSTYVDVTISDPPIVADEEGNLVVATGQVIVKGVVVYSEQVRRAA